MPRLTRFSTQGRTRREKRSREISQKMKQDRIVLYREETKQYGAIKLRNRRNLHGRKSSSKRKLLRNFIKYGAIKFRKRRNLHNRKASCSYARGHDSEASQGKQNTNTKGNYSPQWKPGIACTSLTASGGANATTNKKLIVLQNCVDGCGLSHSRWPKPVRPKRMQIGSKQK